MMVTSNIVLLRHALTAANSNMGLYLNCQPHLMPLSEDGRAQAVEMGKRIWPGMRANPVRVYVSPDLRALETVEYMMTAVAQSKAFVEQEPRLRAQDWGPLDCPDAAGRLASNRYPEGFFYSRLPGGESGAEVYDRVSSFLGFMERRREVVPIRDVIIVTHSMVVRMLLMAMLRWTLTSLESFGSVPPGDGRLVSYSPEFGYQLIGSPFLGEYAVS